MSLLFSLILPLLLYSLPFDTTFVDVYSRMQKAVLFFILPSFQLLQCMVMTATLR